MLKKITVLFLLMLSCSSFLMAASYSASVNLSLNPQTTESFDVGFSGSEINDASSVVSDVVVDLNSADRGQYIEGRFDNIWVYRKAVTTDSFEVSLMANGPLIASGDSDRSIDWKVAEYNSGEISALPAESIIIDGKYGEYSAPVASITGNDIGSQRLTIGAVIEADSFGDYHLDTYRSQLYVKVETK